MILVKMGGPKPSKIELWSSLGDNCVEMARQIPFSCGPVLVSARYRQKKSRQAGDIISCISLPIRILRRSSSEMFVI